MFCFGSKVLARVNSVNYNLADSDAAVAVAGAGAGAGQETLKLTASSRSNVGQLGRRNLRATRDDYSTWFASDLYIV